MTLVRSTVKYFGNHGRSLDRNSKENVLFNLLDLQEDRICHYF